MPNNKYSSIVLMLCSLLFFACKKEGKKEVIKSESADTILQVKATFPDIAYTDSAVVFTCNAPAGYDILWDLGDGTTSTEHSLSHQYKDRGRYYTKLAVSKNGASPFVLYDTVMVTKKYFMRMGGMRNWHYSVFFHILNNREIDSTYVYPDQTFALTLALPDKIVLPDNIYKGDTLRYNGTYDGAIVFQRFNGENFPNNFHISYNIDTDVVTVECIGRRTESDGLGGLITTDFKVTAVSF